MVPPTTPLCWGKIFLFNVEHYQQESLKGFFLTISSFCLAIYLSRKVFHCLFDHTMRLVMAGWCHHHRGPSRHQGPGQGRHDSDLPPQAERGRSRTSGMITWQSAADGSRPLCESKLIFWVDILRSRGRGWKIYLGSSRAWPDSIMFNQIISDSGTHYK